MWWMRLLVGVSCCALVLSCGAGEAPDPLPGQGAGTGASGNGAGASDAGSPGIGGAPAGSEGKDPGTADAWKPPGGTTSPDDYGDGPCGYGTVYGVVCSKKQQIFVNGADVFVETVDCDGNPVKLGTVSDGGGYYTLENVPSGMQTIRVKKGDFEHSYNVLVAAGKLTDVTAVGHKECFKAYSSECPSGDITGYVCAPNETMFIGGATVYVETTDCKGKPVKIGTLSDDNGVFLLENVPVGPQTVLIEKGSFETKYVVTVPENGTVNAPDVVQDACFPTGDVKIAVVTGDWDEIEAVLDALNLEYDLYDGDEQISQAIGLLTSPSLLGTYDIVFFDCGAEHMEIIQSAEAAIVSNLQTFVQNGGSIYASDWAFVYAEWPWPGAIDFFGGDKNPDGPKIGMPGLLQGTVMDPGLAGFLGKKDVLISYDLGSWVVVQGAPADTEVHIEGTIPFLNVNMPLMVSHTPGNGRVLFTTFHNEKQVTGDMIDILKFLVFSL